MIESNTLERDTRGATSENTTLRETLRALQLDGRFVSYTPQFRVEEFQPRCWWILDGEVKIGMIYGEWYAAELINTDPFSPNHDIIFPAAYHAPTQMGERITLSKWIDYGRAAGSDRNDLSFECDGLSVTATLREEWDNGRTAWTRATWKVDADFGYILHYEGEMYSCDAEDPEVCQEYANFLPRGVTDNRREFGARYPYILWQQPSGNIIRWNQNNISARALGATDMKERRRIGTGGFIGFFGEADVNIAVEILQSSPEAAAVTCPNMLDQHIVWNAFVGDIPRGANGEYIYRSSFNLMAVPPALGAELTARAELIDLVTDRRDAELEEGYEDYIRDYPQAKGEPYSLRFYPLEMNKVCDFETPLDPAASFRGQVFPYLEDTDEAISTVSTCGHSGTHSLRLRASGQKLRARAIGCSWHLSVGRRYRLSAWIKTELADGDAKLTAVEYQFGQGNTTATHHSPALRGQNDWQYVATEWTTSERAHIVDIYVDVRGHGTVWADDILIEEI